MNYDKIKVDKVTLTALPEQPVTEVVAQAIGYTIEKGLPTTLNMNGQEYQINEIGLVQFVLDQHGSKEAAPTL